MIRGTEREARAESIQVLYFIAGLITGLIIAWSLL